MLSRFLLALPLLMWSACQPKPKARPAPATAAQPELTRTMKDSIAAQKRFDSLEQAFLDGTAYYPTLIRIVPKQNAFLYIDSMGISTMKDTAVQQMFYHAEMLYGKDRETFYSRIMGALPEEYIAVHKRVWALPEIKLQATGQDGGLYTLATWIVSVPSEEEPYYTVDVRRMYDGRFSYCVPIPVVRVNMRNNTIQVADPVDFEFYPLQKWRRLQKQNDR